MVLAIGAVVVAACREGGDDRPPPDPNPPAAKPPSRTAVKDQDLRVMIAEIAAARACALIRGQFRPLRDSARDGVVTGVLWIRGCEITADGDRLTFAFEANGWQWAERREHQAGATFELAQYVPFAVEARIPGSLDIAYHPKKHVATLWFTPTRAPAVQFTPIGDLDVDAEGAWSAVVSTVAAAIGKSPDREAGKQASREGVRELRDEFADGLSVTIDLCTGLTRFGLGRPATGEMVAPDPGETTKVPIELEQGGVTVLGPYRAPDGMTARIRVRDGAIRAELACHDHGVAVADAYLHGRPPPARRALAARDVRHEATLRVKRASCPVVLIARPLGGAAATFDWLRPPREAAEATGGPMVACDRR
jgi:hypothetical protein